MQNLKNYLLKIKGIKLLRISKLIYFRWRERLAREHKEWIFDSIDCVHERDARERIGNADEHFLK